MGSISSPYHSVKPWRETPLLESPSLSRIAGCRIFMKLDNLQPSGSFKSRGVGNLMVEELSRSAHPDRAHFYSSSGGNAGLACVTAASALNRPATVVVPMSTTQLMIDMIRIAGGEVIQFGENIAAADKYLREELLQRDPYGIYTPPFDHPWIWKGNSSIVDEIVQQFPQHRRLDAIVCSVGGGGLFNGIIEGLENYSLLPQTKIIAVETTGTASLHTSLLEGSHVTLPKISGIATSLGCPRISKQTYEYAMEWRDSIKTTVLSDAEAVRGCKLLADLERTIVEPACGVCISLCLKDRLRKLIGNDFGPETSVVLVVCGGSNVSLQKLEEWSQEFGLVK